MIVGRRAIAANRIRLTGSSAFFFEDFWRDCARSLASLPTSSVSTLVTSQPTKVIPLRRRSCSVLYQITQFRAHAAARKMSSSQMAGQRKTEKPKGRCPEEYKKRGIGRGSGGVLRWEARSRQYKG